MFEGVGPGCGLNLRKLCLGGSMSSMSVQNTSNTLSHNVIKDEGGFVHLVAGARKGQRDCNEAAGGGGGGEEILREQSHWTQVTHRCESRARVVEALLSPSTCVNTLITPDTTSTNVGANALLGLREMRSLIL
jgi:hypothetical protein